MRATYVTITIDRFEFRFKALRGVYIFGCIRLARSMILIFEYLDLHGGPRRRRLTQGSSSHSFGEGGEGGEARAGFEVL